MFCQSCGTKIEEGDLFCRNCGETSEALTYLADKQNLLAQGGLFIAGSGAFGAVLMIVTVILFALIPALKSPETALWILLVMGSLVSGVVTVLLREYRITRRKLLEERERRRVLLSSGEINRIETEEIRGLPYSVVDQTTQKFKV